MKFIADINITQSLIKYLRQDGHDVLDLKSQNPEMTDINIIKIAQRENRIILTHDKDFELLMQHPKYQAGLILIRLKTQNSKHFYLKLKNLINSESEKSLTKSLTVLTEESATPKEY